jgi:hypothetical protein
MRICFKEVGDFEEVEKMFVFLMLKDSFCGLKGNVNI